MGGGEKFLLDLDGQTLLQRAIGRLLPQVDHIAISANCDPVLLADYPYPVLPDPLPAGRGPLAGIMAGLDWAAASSGASHLTVVASDTPFFPTDLVERLVSLTKSDPDAIILSASGGRTHPVFGLWPLSVGNALRDWLESGASLKVTDFTDSRKHHICDFPFGDDRDPFFNVNTPEEMTKARNRISQEAL